DLHLDARFLTWGELERLEGFETPRYVASYVHVRLDGNCATRDDVSRARLTDRFDGDRHPPTVPDREPVGEHHARLGGDVLDLTRYAECVDPVEVRRES